MANYDYKDGKKRVLDIINSSNDIEDKDKVPLNVDSFSYSNGYYSWVTSFFVDIRGSTDLFRNNKKTTVAKIIRSFSSEIIEILKNDDNCREIGIRGDCVYAIYTCSQKDEDYEILDKAFYVNTFINMLNEILKQNSMPTIKTGIGIATGKELVVKAGRKGSKVNNLVWIGGATTSASNLASIANKGRYDKILISSSFYESTFSLLKDKNSPKSVEGWFTRYSDAKNGIFYGCNVIKTRFDEWIEEGMIDN